MKTGMKLTIGFLAVTAIAGTIGIVGSVSLKSIDTADTKMYEKETLPVSYLLAITEAFQRTRLNITDMVIASTDEERAPSEKTITTMTDTLDKNQSLYAKSIQTEAGQKLFDTFMTAYNAYQEPFAQVMSLAKQNKKDEATAILLGPGRKAAQAVQAAIDDLVKWKTENAHQMAQANRALADMSTIIMILSIIVGVVASIVLGFLLTRSVTRPLAKGVKFAQVISGGDFTQKLDIHRC
jgi:methyl-accepting chemotaxis protein